jgi:hypothetical protein
MAGFDIRDNYQNSELYRYMSGKFTLSEDVRGVFKKISLELKRKLFCYVIIILMYDAFT